MSVIISLGYDLRLGKTRVARLYRRADGWGIGHDYLAPIGRYPVPPRRSGAYLFRLEPGVYELSDLGGERYVRVDADGSITRLPDVAAALEALDEPAEA